MGAVGGGMFHLLKGMKNSPKGGRMVGGLEAIRREAPRIGGSFAIWGGLFSTFDCTLVAIRKKEDPWNPIMAGALTGGFLQMRHGPASATRHAIFGGLILAGIEGIGIMITRMVAPPPPPPPGFEPPPGMAPMGVASPPPPLPPPEAESQGSSGITPGSIWATLFGDEKKEEEPKPFDLSSDKFAAPPLPKEFQGGEPKFS